MKHHIHVILYNIAIDGLTGRNAKIVAMATQAKKRLKGGRQYHHGDLRRELLRIARDEIARNGAQTVSLSSLARLAGVSQPAPYRHFADRNALLEAVAEEGFNEFDRALAEAEAGCRPRDALRAMSNAYVAFGEANVEVYRLMFASRLVPEATAGSALAMAADSAFDRLRRAMSAIAPPERVEKDALLVWAQLHGLVMLRADGLICNPLREFVAPDLLKQALRISRKR